MNTNYELEYLQQLLNGAVVEPPNPNQGNGSYDHLQMLYGQYMAGGPEQVAQAITALSPSGAPPTHSPETPRFNILSWQEVLNLPPTKWLIPNEIPEKGIALVFGESGVGKSYLCLDYALRITNEHDVPVLYVVGEGSSTYGNRIRAWMKYHGKQCNKLRFLLEPVNLFDSDEVEQFIEECFNKGFALIIFDTLAACAEGVDENANRDIGIVFANCKRIINRLNTTVALVHHATKNGNSYRGSSAIKGSIDSMIEVKKKGNSITKICIKLRDGKEWEPQQLKFERVELDDGESNQVLVSSQNVPEKADELTKREYDVLKFIVETQNRSGEPPKREQIVEALPHITEPTLKNDLLPDLRKKKFLTYDKKAKKNPPTEKAINLFKEEESTVINRHDDIIMGGHNLSSSRHNPLRGYDGDGYDDGFMTDERLEELLKSAPSLDEGPEPVWVDVHYDEGPPEMSEEMFRQILKTMPPPMPMTDEDWEKERQEYLIEMQAMKWRDEYLN